MLRLVLFVSVLGLISCGKKSKGGGGGDGYYSKTVATADDLPTCDSGRENHLVYILEDKKFQTCLSGEWTDIDVTEAVEPLSVTAWYSYQTTTYASSQNLVTDGGAAVAYLGNINLYMMSNDTAIVSVNGSFRDTDTGGSDNYYDDFTTSFTIYKKNKTYLYPTYFKLKPYVDTTLRYQIDITEEPPTFKAYVDTDGNQSNDTVRSFTLDD